MTDPAKPTKIDTAALTVPVKAILGGAEGTSLCALTEGATWSGLWAFPDSPVWSEEDRETWTQVRGHHIAETARLASAVAALDAAANSPASLLASARLDVDEVQRAREAAERHAKGEAAWLKAREALGAHCTRVDHEEGDVFILRPMKDIEIQVAEHQADLLAKPHPEGSVRARTERTGAILDALILSICHPPAERVRQVFDAYPLFSGHLLDVRNRLIFGLRAEQGKGFAP